MARTFHCEELHDLKLPALYICMHRLPMYGDGNKKLKAYVYGADQIQQLIVEAGHTLTTKQLLDAAQKLIEIAKNKS